MVADIQENGTPRCLRVFRNPDPGSGRPMRGREGDEGMLRTARKWTLGDASAFLLALSALLLGGG